jgi:hypothetical protein
VTLRLVQVAALLCALARVGVCAALGDEATLIQQGFQAAAVPLDNVSSEAILEVAERLRSFPSRQAVCARAYLLVVLRHYPSDLQACEGVVFSREQFPSAPGLLRQACAEAACPNILDLRTPTLTLRIPGDVVELSLNPADQPTFLLFRTTERAGLEAPRDLRIFRLEGDCELGIRAVNGEETMIDLCANPQPAELAAGVVALGRSVTLQRDRSLLGVPLRLDEKLALAASDEIFVSDVPHRISRAQGAEQVWLLEPSDTRIDLVGEAAAPPARRPWSVVARLDGVLQRNSGVASLLGLSLEPWRHVDIDAGAVLAPHTWGGWLGGTVLWPFSGSVDGGLQLGGVVLTPHTERGEEMAGDRDLIWGAQLALTAEVRPSFWAYRTRWFGSFGLQSYATGESRFKPFFAFLSAGARVGL